VDEKRVLTRYWEAVHQERETADETEFDNYVAYVVDTYTIPAVLSFKEGRVVRAEDLLVKASERLQLIPMTPLQFESRDSDFLRNATLILAAFLEDRTAVVLQQASFRKAVDCLLSKLPPAARNDWVIKESTAPPRAIEAFMLAVYLLDELRYEDCIAQTAKVLSARPSPRLLQITLLMQLQSELKRRERLKPTKIRNSLVNLRNVYATLDQSPYASQLKYYREKLGQ